MRGWGTTAGAGASQSRNNRVNAWPQDMVSQRYAVASHASETNSGARLCPMIRCSTFQRISFSNSFPVGVEIAQTFTSLQTYAEMPLNQGSNVRIREIQTHLEHI